MVSCGVTGGLSAPWASRARSTAAATCSTGNEMASSTSTTWTSSGRFFPRTSSAALAFERPPAATASATTGALSSSRASSTSLRAAPLRSPARSASHEAASRAPWRRCRFRRSTSPTRRSHRPSHAVRKRASRDHSRSQRMVVRARELGIELSQRLHQILRRRRHANTVANTCSHVNSPPPCRCRRARPGSRPRRPQSRLLRPATRSEERGIAQVVVRVDLEQLRPSASSPPASPPTAARTRPPGRPTSDTK